MPTVVLPALSAREIILLCFYFVCTGSALQCAVFLSSRGLRLGCPVARAIGLHCYRHRSGAKSCLTLCNPRGCSPPGSSVHGILQERMLERLPFPSPGDLPGPGIKPASALAGEFFTTSTTWAEKAMAPHSSTLAWKVPWTEEPGRHSPWGL